MSHNKITEEKSTGLTGGRQEAVNDSPETLLQLVTLDDEHAHTWCTAPHVAIGHNSELQSPVKGHEYTGKDGTEVVTACLCAPVADEADLPHALNTVCSVRLCKDVLKLNL